MQFHKVCLASFLAMPNLAFAQSQSAEHVTYDTYAAGLHVAKVEAGFGLGPRSYQLTVRYRTTGMVGFFFRGQQVATVSGAWNGAQSLPSEYYGVGHWGGEDRVVRIDYDHGRPVVRELVPTNDEEREEVPESLRLNSIDTASALMQLVHVVGTTGRCETAARSFDGRRAVEIRVVTAGEQVLQPAKDSIFAGKALRCDFTGHMLAGFKLGEDRAKDAKPMHGSIWLAPVVPGGPAVPVRLAFETRWFGDATMYLTAAGEGAAPETEPN